MGALTLQLTSTPELVKMKWYRRTCDYGRANSIEVAVLCRLQKINRMELKHTHGHTF